MRVDKIIDDLGGVSGLAKKLKSRHRHGRPLTKQAVSMWKKSKRIPVEHVLALEELSEGRYTRHQMRPDIFGSAQ